MTRQKDESGDADAEPHPLPIGLQDRRQSEHDASQVEQGDFDGRTAVRTPVLHGLLIEVGFMGLPDFFAVFQAAQQRPAGIA